MVAILLGLSEFPLYYFAKSLFSLHAVAGITFQTSELVPSVK